MLCDICQRITFRLHAEDSDVINVTPRATDDPIRHFFYRHQPSIAALYVSQLEGSHLCALSWFALAEYGSLATFTGLRSLNGVWLCYFPWPADAEVEVIEVIFQGQTTTLDVFKPESITPRSSVK
jgi:hypothetical protein